MNRGYLRYRKCVEGHTTNENTRFCQLQRQWCTSGVDGICVSCEQDFTTIWNAHDQIYSLPDYLVFTWAVLRAPCRAHSEESDDSQEVTVPSYFLRGDTLSADDETRSVWTQVLKRAKRTTLQTSGCTYCFWLQEVLVLLFLFSRFDVDQLPIFAYSVSTLNW